MVLEIRGTRKRSPARRVFTDVRSLAGVCPDVNLAYVGGGEGAVAALIRALEGPLTCGVKNEIPVDSVLQITLAASSLSILYSQHAQE